MGTIFDCLRPGEANRLVGNNVARQRSDNRLGHLVWPEYRIALVPLVNQALHLFAGPAEFAFRTATGVAKRGTDVADHAADVPIPDAAHTSGA